ncbi:hypothetical protein [Flexithrix dorotheae]|uniref:hypothetical protein n=1 Tax=Flexithrix dorotheae TaxID=70993 RepID=UPI00035EC147|nr:hypothetical protein [Flexithrix dorotheae]
MRLLNLILIILPCLFIQNAKASDPEYAIIETKSGEKIEAEIDTFEEGVIISQGNKLHYSIDGEKHKINYKEIKMVSLVNRISVLN